ncbi:MAG: hypothetical protein ACKVOH_01665 [Chlamydiales bacterium]
MKRLFLLLAFLEAALFALPLDNPTQASFFTSGVFFDPCKVNPCDPFFVWADAVRFRVGYYGDFVFDRRMEEIRLGDKMGSVNKASLSTNAVELVSNIYNWMEVFATFGVTNLSYQTHAVDSGLFSRLECSPSFSWSVGGRGTLFQCGYFRLGGEGQYFRLEPDVNRFFNLGAGQVLYFNSTNHMVYEEWQIGFALSAQFMTAARTSLVPYLGLTISQGKLLLKNFQFVYNGVVHMLPDMLPRDIWGFAMGMTCLVRDAMGITLEGRWNNETALFVNGQFRY